MQPVHYPLYGIRNCETVMKARAWLETHGVRHDFYDFKIQGIDPESLQAWCAELGWQVLLNRRRHHLPKASRSAAAGLGRGLGPGPYADTTLMIKRPILDLGPRRLAGFSPAAYEAAFR